MSETSWWKGAVIYQIYPRSFYDSNHDGVGDLAGITKKLPYIASLGVDAIWISPFFKSPMKDFGYDISDYQAVDPLFGDMNDFDNLLERAHQLGIKVMIDQVLSHTSDQHAWFTQSRQNKTNDKADWYMWADANQDGTPPNNWLSIFGGMGWQWDSRRQQYYLHNFLSSQPDLNFHNPDVQQAVLDNIEYWLKKGVDGLRLDAITFCFNDKELRDNPAKPIEERNGRGFSEDNPYAYQYHYFNNDRPETLDFMLKIRALLDRYPGTAALGEISSEDSIKSMAEYTQGNRLQMAYSFELLTDDFSVEHITTTVQQLEAQMKDGWPCWAISNHDVARVVTRWGKGHAKSKQLAKMFTALVTSLRGSVCSYQGEELGLEEAELEFENLQDPFGIEFWPTFKGRDGCRTPMPWHIEKEHAGFSQNAPWLPVSPAHQSLSVDTQIDDPTSSLVFYQTWLKWRTTQDILKYGDIKFVDLHSDVLCFYREYKGKKWFVSFNLSAQAQSIVLSESTQPINLKFDILQGQQVGQIVNLPAHGIYFGNCA
ncbi:alpha-glucosidase family protein [Paraglaciecola aquimarina]|uniref:Alpha-glucosidase family protein n=1 Tax=Paraglaciecola algarum TaxID=3050085 RepID=A0ABS9DA89_9ALTE|nr:alpha-glucosidase [Paraglaciecola sp. G1-23]MCF2949861.1 alpha-glucosidase family protein [Paraglaciecola sp. G1-23]